LECNSDYFLNQNQIIFLNWNYPDQFFNEFFAKISI